MNALKPRLLVLGTGFGAVTLLKSVDSKYYDVTAVSPRNHFLFTPLLPSTTVGTLEFRSIVEPVRRACPQARYYQASSRSLRADQKRVGCVSAIDGTAFEIPYDLLVVAVGAKVNTFGIAGVAENALFLKTIDDARRIRRRVIECFELSSQPNVTDDRRRQLLHFVSVGGGPTGVEFAAELNDFLMGEIKRAFPSLMPFVKVTVIDAADHLLSAFDHSLSDFATAHFKRQNITVLSKVRVTEVARDALHLNNGDILRYGLLVWSTGIGPTIAVNNFDLPKDKASRILVDETLKVKGHEDLYALGDCSFFGDKGLPATAQVAMQQGKYLAKALNQRAQGKAPGPFHYHNYGMLAYVGDDEAIADVEGLKAKGKAAFFFWRSAYFTRLLSVKNKILVLFDWAKASLFGRDISRL
ncbi:MAG TPA: FAD-dependent oxidoreductase [bacterium]|nr:FAD-dependent oxidoreductase [bacterium]